jgi:hypothetical protein
MHLQALLTKWAVKSLDVCIQIGPVRGDDIGYHSHTPKEPHQCRGEIPSQSTFDKAWVIVKGKHPGQAMFTQKLGHGFQQDFSIEIATHLAVQPDRGASIDEVGNLHHMLLLALSIGGHTTGVFEIELDFLPWLSQL